ncbi:hypothetical protein BJ741DRAFT_704078 [Chytriomyces cf. hyalinus JEL632]|nr:hypothetical protein BJ741DRAFT_704078 [Chytriomyces cf. hyalinus JEL632]
MDATDMAVSWLQEQLRSQLRENSTNTVKYAQFLERQTHIPRQVEEMKDHIAELQDQIQLLLRRVSELESERGHVAKSRLVVNAGNGATQNGNPRIENTKSVDTAKPPAEHTPQPAKESQSLKRTSTTPDSAVSELTPASKKRSTTSSSTSSPWSSLKSLTSESPIQTPLLFQKPPPDVLADGTRNKHGHRSWIQIMKAHDPTFTVNASSRSRMEMFHGAYNLSKVEMKFHNTPGIPERLFFEFCEFMKVGWRGYREKDSGDFNSDAKITDVEKPSGALRIDVAVDGSVNLDVGTTPAEETKTDVSAALPETLLSGMEDCVIVDAEVAPAQESTTASKVSQTNNHDPSTPRHQSASANAPTPKSKSTGVTTPSQSDGVDTHSGRFPSTPVQNHVSPNAASHIHTSSNATTTSKVDPLDHKKTPSQNDSAAHPLRNGLTDGNFSIEKRRRSKSNNPSSTPSQREEPTNSSVPVSSAPLEVMPSSGKKVESINRIPKGIKYVKIVRQIMPSYNGLDKASKSAIHAGVRDYLFEALGNNESRARKCIPPGFTMETSQMYWIPQYLVPEFQDWVYIQLGNIFPKSNLVKPVMAVAANLNV